MHTVSVSLHLGWIWLTAASLPIIMKLEAIRQIALHYGFQYQKHWSLYMAA